MTSTANIQNQQRLRTIIQSAIERSESILNHINGLAVSGQIEKLGEEAVRKLMVSDRVLARRYPLEAAATMIGVSRHIISTAEAKGELPEPDYRIDTTRRIRAGYTINQINDMRAHFGTLPQLPESIKASIVAFLNLKGGCQKSTMTLFFAHWLAIQGYRVLCLDTDPQASLTESFGLVPDREIQYADTIGPYMLEDGDALVEAGHDPKAFLSLHYAVRPTYWNRIDIIPGCLDLLNIDLQANRGERHNLGVNKLRIGLKELGQDYDFILIDGTPSLNVSTLNVVSATDQVFVPAPAEMSDYRSTVKFLGMLKEVLESYIARGVDAPFPHFNFLINKKTKTNYSEYMTDIIQRTFNDPDGSSDLVLEEHVNSSNEVGKSLSEMTYLFETSPSETSNREGLRKAEQNYNAVFENIMETLRQNLDPEAVSIQSLNRVLNH
ncbi:cobyrinic acid a,c-diamide synthase [gamma proteobacterium BDW918]|nr:cobyrinic acid a,c-diamide synthase [gamma proteobacterium BDW918]